MWLKLLRRKFKMLSTEESESLIMWSRSQNKISNYKYNNISGYSTNKFGQANYGRQFNNNNNIHKTYHNKNNFFWS